MVLTLENIQLYTLYPDGTTMKTLNTATLQKKNRIGEYKKIIISYIADESIASNVIYFSPAFFLQAGTIPPWTGKPTGSYYSLMVDPSVTGGSYDMNLTCAPGYVADLIKNWEVKLILQDYVTTFFQIEITFYQMYDLNSFMNPSITDNLNKFLKDRRANASQLVVSGKSIYNETDYCPQFYTYIEKYTDPSIYYSLLTTFPQYEAGFYGKNELEATGYFRSPTFVLEAPSGTVVTKISSAHDTKVTFGVIAPVSITNMIFWLIKIPSPRANFDDFKTTYDSSTVLCTTTGGSATQDNKIKAPMVGPTFVGPLTNASFYIDKTTVAPGEKYRIIGIPYYDGATYEVNSFISEEYEVDLPSYEGAYEITGSIKDYDKEWTGNDLICVVEERLISKLRLDFSADAFKNDILSRLGITLATNDIQRYLTKITCEIYEDETASLRHYLARSVAIKIDPSPAYAIPSQIQLAGGVDTLQILFNYRVRYESWAPNVETTYAGVPLGAPTSNQNWAGRTLKVRFMLDLYYDDYSSPFTDRIVFTQTLRPKDYEEGQTLQILKDDEKEAPSASEFFCDDEITCFAAKTNLTNPSQYRLMTTVEKSPGSAFTVEENETWAGSQLAQLTTDKFASQESLFSQTEATCAKFCTDNVEFDKSIQYKISAIAKKVNGLYA